MLALPSSESQRSPLRQSFASLTRPSFSTSSIPDLMVTFGASQTLATAGLTLFVLAYGIGPSTSFLLFATLTRRDGRSLTRPHPFSL